MLSGLYVHILTSLLALKSLAAATPTTSTSFLNASILYRDVAIIGGGASGTYAAIRLQQEGKSVALLEKQSQLGGHVDTYTDPTTNQTVDYGVQVFSNLTVLRDFFAHFDVPLVNVDLSGGSSQTINLKTGASVPSSIDAVALGTALYGYQAQLARFPGIEGGWDLSYPVDEDLLMPFGDFLDKYNLTALAFVAFSYNQGIGNILAQPTLYVMKYFDAQLVSDLINSAFVVNGLQDNQLLYNRAQAELGANAFVNAEVNSVVRTDAGVTVVAKAEEGKVIIMASKLLLAIPPKLSNVGFLDLSHDEYTLFGQFNNSYYWDAVVKNTGLPAGVTISNVDSNAALGVPAMPGPYTISPTAIKDTSLMYYGSDSPLSDDDVKAALLDTIATIAKGQNLKIPAGGPEIVAFGDHSPFMLTVSTDAVKSGFYKDLEALQGQRSTWWTGAAWNTHATAVLYNFTEYEILPHLL